MLYHQYCGYTLLGLLVFRIYWGFWGTETARFFQFLTSPTNTLNYLRRLPQKEVPRPKGHNPLGGYSVIALLTLLLTQIILGLFAIDVDGFDGGPFSYEISFETGRLFAQWHELTFNLLLGLITIHILAAFYYLFRRKQNLIGPMFHGQAKGIQGESIQATPWYRAALGLLIAVAVPLALLFFTDSL